jgi:hypothetical protein
MGCIGGLLPMFGVNFTKTVGVVHTIGVIQGGLLLGAAAGWHLMPFDQPTEAVTGWLLLGPLWSNLLGVYVAALTNSAGNAFDPSFTCVLLSKEVAANVVVSLLLNCSLPILVPFGTCAFISLFPHKGNGPWFWKVNVGLGVLLFVIAIVLTVVIPVVNPLLGVTNSSVAVQSIHGQEKKVFLCPFAYKPGPEGVEGLGVV